MGLDEWQDFCETIFHMKNGRIATAIRIAARNALELHDYNLMAASKDAGMTLIGFRLLCARHGLIRKSGKKREAKWIKA